MFKKLLLIIVCVLTTTTSLYAVPAAPHLHDLQQPDGTTISARQWGDEHFHGWETDAGHSIVFDKKIKGWAYAVHDSAGHLASSAVLVDKTANVPNWVQKRLRPLKSSSTTLSPSILSGVNNAPAPSVKTTGTKNIPVILINFSDSTFTYTAANIQTLLFGNSNSMKAFYLENSYNQLTLSSGPSGVVGPYTASQTHNYYGQDLGGEGKDAYPAILVKEAIQKAITAGFKFAPYVDQTTTCKVDSVAIVHQGSGQEATGSGIATDIWSHSWDLSDSNALGSAYDTGESCSLGGHIWVDHYVIQPEVLGTGMTTFGVFAHEYGHALGLPDLYDTTNSSEGAGEWSVMAGGVWLGHGGDGWGGDSPSHFDAWSKYYLGWINPASISGVNSSVSIAAVSSTTPNYYKIGTGTPTSGEYFLLENRNKSGFDSYLPGSGLLVWHIAGSTVSTNFDANSVNDHPCTSTTAGACSGTSSHYGVALIQADNALHMEKNTNQGDANDPYFSPKTLTNSTAPNTRFWSGSASGYGVTAISSSAATMTATLIGSPIAPAVATSSVSEIRATSATLNGTVNDNNAATQVSFEYGPTSGYGRTASGVSISAGFGTTAESVTISGLVCNSIYHYRITGSNTISTSISADSSFTTSACPPDAPAITSVAVGNSLANIYFVPPGSDNGSPISSYTATSNSGQYVNGETVPLTVSGLVNGSSYTFTVRARNAAGEGPASPVSEGVTPGVVVIDDVDAFGYQQLQHAYDADTSGKKIKLLADTSVGALTVDSLNSKGIVTITGGYNNAFSDHDGQSSILGKVTLSAGTTRFQNVKVRLP